MDLMKVLCNNTQISSASQTSCEVIELQDNAQKVSVYTQTDNFGRSNTGTTCIEACYLNALFSIFFSSPVAVEVLDRASFEMILE